MKIVGGIFVICIVAVGCAKAFDLHVNWTESMPRGLYRSVEPTFGRGEWVAVCLEGDAAAIARERAYVIDGSCREGLAAVFKQIRAVPGDRVELDVDGVHINGEAVAGSMLSEVDSKGRRLANAGTGERLLADGTFWVMGTNLNRSWDSRYFGVVRETQIIGKAVPVLTFE